MNPIHASCVELEGMGVLLRGPSGAGKSDLALRLIDAGASLVADDQVLLEARAGRLVASAPDTLAGLIEVRGLGILRLPHRRTCAVDLVADLVSPGRIARLPDERRVELAGLFLPAIDLAPFEASAVAKLRFAARMVSGGEALSLSA